MNSAKLILDYNSKYLNLEISPNRLNINTNLRHVPLWRGLGGGIFKNKMEKAAPENNYHYNKELNSLATQLKKQMTKSEACMWKYLLQSKQFFNYSFRRQRPILNYIVDFCCLDLLLIIEVDGITHEHDYAIKKDLIRDTKLKEIGFTVFRFDSGMVLKNMVEIDIILTQWMIENEYYFCPPPTPSKGGQNPN